jgi:dihydroorotase/N-acyl-D-amino-acid deacylase
MSAAWLFLLGFFFQDSTGRYDLLITNAKIVDGSGAPWYRGDIAIEDGRIAAVGLLGGAAAVQKIDAGGLVVSPGFIDIHTHARRGIFEDPAAQNYIRQGVTTLIEGNDGSSPLPLAPFFQKLEQAPLGVNFATFVGQGSIRQQVLALENRKATPEEIEKMRVLTKQAMLDGAFGLSTGLFYVPGNFTPTEEVIELAKVAGAMGGMHISHMRDEAAEVLESVKETIRIGEEGGLPTQVTHHKTVGTTNWGRSVDTLKLMEAARARGVDVTIDQYPYTASSTSTSALFPQWSLAGGAKALGERLAAPGQRAKIKASIVTNIIDNRGGGDPKNVVMANCSWDASLAGKSLSDITAMHGRPVTLENAAETAIEIQLKGGCQAVFHAIDEKDVERILQSRLTMIGSDGEIPRFGFGAPHPRSYGTFARVLARYVRERHAITLEDAVYKMSGYPAARLKLEDRGLLRVGMKADVVIFDPAKVDDKATFENPHQYAVGFRDVIVNGKPVILGGKLTGAHPGQVLYGPAKAR